MSNEIKQASMESYNALGLPSDFMNLVSDEDAADFVAKLSDEKRRKLTVGLALLHLQIPDAIRYELLTNHIDETERLVHNAFQDLSASLVNKLSHEGSAETKSTLGSVRLAMLMNILGFDDATLSGVLNDPILTRRASLVAVTGLNEMGQKIQQLYDEKNNEPT
ncbi:hypothetical protein pEaSNUABM30_00035 [Erwinia phage pEa_SNUABM_30]|uniref:Uncharacterized protein n=1 Tax=Erwinia phage pEa_SNUABM_30 TaxID=2869553 RepID=A0AAE8XL46_9CAUD|nr:hypothetical protein MPK69_gp035 [Erwinia phage pEa_SNUABM_30]UAW53153.1 hypothetical protein pEaSNUABM30_00035 [Erwinia phage pEa_SNUABM_30]